MVSQIWQIMRWGKGARRKLILTSILHVVLWPVTIIPRLFWPRRRPRPISDGGRILLIRMDGIGDLAMSSAAISSLRREYPLARIDVLTSQVAAPVAQLLCAAGWLNTVWTMPLAGRSIKGYLEMSRQFRAAAYDAALDLRGDPRNVLLMWLSGIPTRLGMPPSGINYLLTRVADLPHPHHQAAECAELVRLLGVREVEPWPQLPLSEDLRAQADQWLTEHKIDASRPVCAMHIGAFLPTKVWPLERFIAVARRLRESHDMQFLLVGGESEAQISQVFAREFGEGVFIAAGNASLPLTAALLSRCALMIGNDSGPAHVAAYVGCPVVTLFSVSDPRIYGPLSPYVVILKASRPCEPGCERVCQRPPDQHCMLEHTVDVVFTAAERLLQLREAPAGSA